MSESDYTVRLERVFQGPLDLLLHLVREQEMEIHEVEIARIVDGYLAYLSSLESLDVEYAADFLVMAATLMAIKSRSLLPHEALDLEDEFDPRDELIQRLIEYRRFKQSADHLESAWQTRARQHGTGGHAELPATEREYELGELTAFDLLSVWSRLLRETMADRPHHVVREGHPLRFFVEHVVQRLRAEPSIDLRRVIETLREVPKREALVGSFCALLELVKLQLIEVRQAQPRADISISVVPEHRDDLEEVVRANLLELEAREEAEARAARPGEPAPVASSEPATNGG